ncbi:MAG: hypothetical protein WCO66_00290 [Candidatus Absconditabacteria bacterium]
MTSLDLVHKQLPETLRTSAMEYTIDDTALESRSDLIALILNSKSIDGKEEKQSRFSLLPIMDEGQIGKLYDILHREEQKIQEIEQKYDAKKTSIIQKYQDKTYSSPVYQNTIDNIKSQEAAQEAQEDKEADMLLNNL